MKDFINSYKFKIIVKYGSEDIGFGNDVWIIMIKHYK